MLKYQRLDDGISKNNNNTTVAARAPTTTTLMMNSTTTDEDDDDDENYALYARDKYQQNRMHTTKTSEKPTPSEGLSLFEELNNCHVNAAIGADVDMEHITMEIPLLGNNNNHDYDQQHTQYSPNDRCRAEQPGFGANLTNKSTQEAKFKILLAIALCIVFMLIEFVGGYIAGSLAIMTDAAHLASDCISFIIGLVAIWLGSRPPDAKMSFGYKRMEVLGAIISVLGIWILTATLVAVAIQRVFTNDYDLDANAMMTISGIGIIINIVMVFILHGSEFGGAAHGHSHSHAHAHAHSHSAATSNYTHLQVRTRRTSSTDSSSSSFNAAAGQYEAPRQTADMSAALQTNVNTARMPVNGDVWKEINKHDSQVPHSERNLNLRAAMIHVIGDLVQSVGVFLASILIKFFPNAKVADPLCTMLFSVIVILTTVHLFKESVNILMDAVPCGFKLNELERDLSLIEGVKSVHHLNVWNHTADYSVLMVHLVIEFLADNNAVLAKATNIATSQKYNIKHCTIQIERLTS